MIDRMFYTRWFVTDLVLTAMMLLLVPVAPIIMACHYEVFTWWAFVLFYPTFAWLFWIIYEQIFIPKIKEYRRIRVEAKKIIRAHNQQHFKKQLSRLCEGGLNII